MGDVMNRGGPREKGVMVRGLGSMLGGVVVFFAIGILNNFWLPALILGIGLVAGGLISVRQNVNRVTSFLMLVVGVVLLLRFIPFVRNLVDIFLYLGAGAMVLIGALAVYKEFRRRNS